MSYKTILIHLDRGARRNERLELGFALGQAFDAHVVGLYAIAAPRIPSHALAEAGPTVTQIEARRRAEDARDAEAVFRAAAGRHGGARAEWRASSSDALAALRLHARYADLVVVGQPQDGDAENAGVPPGLAGDLVLSAGRPVLVVPYTGRFAGTGKRALVAWNASREAARAVSDALPLLERAEAVRVVSFHPERDDHGAEPGADIGLALARHGVKVEVARQPGGDVEAGEEILSRAADFAADLIVMGGYGHARLRELVLGGATRTILESMTVPVLMSH